MLADQQADKCAPFIAIKTINAMRITIRSTIELVEALLDPQIHGLKYVLTGKFNQNCLEVLALVQLIRLDSHYLLPLYF